MVILGISIGTKTTGIAVLRNGSLIVWDTHTLRGKWSDKKIDVIISRCGKHIATHKVTLVVIKVPPVTHHSTNITDLLLKLYSFVQYKGCMVEYKTKDDIKRIEPSIKNTHDLIEFATFHYPKLLPERTQELTNKNKYHLKMFEAVIVAHIHKQ